jgi:hypothetical protein
MKRDVRPKRNTTSVNYTRIKKQALRLACQKKRFEDAIDKDRMYRALCVLKDPNHDRKVKKLLANSRKSR